MYYSKINKLDIANGPGCRVSVFVSGCTNCCEGCFNKETWDFKYGKEFTQNTIDTILAACDKSFIQGLTLLGGDPCHINNIQVVTTLAKEFKRRFQKKSIWLYTGYEWEDIKDTELIKYVDVAVVGPFILEQRDISDENRWRGSRNQRVILVPESLKQNRQVNLQNIPNND